MPFMPKSGKQANFLHALKGDQTKGLPPVAAPMSPPMAGGLKSPMAPPMAPPIGNPMMKPPMPINPVAAPHIAPPPMPNLRPPMQPMGNPNVPALPNMGKLPKFAKTRNSLKGGPFKKQ
jgi:hypothetical protein